MRSIEMKNRWFNWILGALACAGTFVPGKQALAHNPTDTSHASAYYIEWDSYAQLSSPRLTQAHTQVRVSDCM